MTAKRFCISSDSNQNIYDTEEKCYYSSIDAMKLCELLNELYEENTYLKLELDTHKHPLWSTREAERKVSEITELLADEVKKNGELLKENNLLQIENKRLKHREDF